MASLDKANRTGSYVGRVTNVDPLWLIHIASESDDLDVHNTLRLIDRVDHSNISDSEAKTSFEFTAQPLDVVVFERVL